MIRSLTAARRAMLLEQSRIDALANNLANVNTAGFKQILTRVAEVDAGQSDRSTGQEPVRLGPDSLELHHALDPRPGQIRATGRETDVAVIGRGYFAVKTTDGTAYTRHGSFLRSESGELITPEGRPVLGTRGPVVISGTDFEIAPNGAVTVDGEFVDRLALVDFDDPGRLTHLGGSLLAPPPDMPARGMGEGEITLAQGHLEGSNVNPIDTLVAMIAAQRAFEVQSKVLQTEDEMLEKSVNTLPRIGG